MWEKPERRCLGKANGQRHPWVRKGGQPVCAWSECRAAVGRRARAEVVGTAECPEDPARKQLGYFEDCSVRSSTSPWALEPLGMYIWIPAQGQGLLMGDGPVEPRIRRLILVLRTDGPIGIMALTCDRIFWDKSGGRYACPRDTTATLGRTDEPNPEEEFLSIVTVNITFLSQRVRTRWCSASLRRPGVKPGGALG